MIEYTVKQIAELLKVSKPTVQKTINALSIAPAKRENNNRAYYSQEDTVTIIKSIDHGFDVSVLQEPDDEPPSETAKPQNYAEITEKPPSEAQNNEGETAKTEKPPSEEIELLRNMLGVIQEQLKEKDKQLAVKDKQIQDLSDRLAEAMQLTRGQQYIAAADKTTELLEAEKQEEAAAPAPINPKESDEEIEEQPLKKKSFWQRLFGF